MTEQECITMLEATGDYRIVRRLKPVEQYCQDSGAQKHIGIYLDTETTGMNPDKDSIIEIALVPFEYDDAGNIYRVFSAYNALQDPGFPIPHHITEITHITNKMVKGQAIDWKKVTYLLKDVSIVIAHNARFDRPFVEKALSDFENLPWGCSINDINWNEEGYEGVKLEYLAYKHGFFYEGHRATIDCQAGIEILNATLPLSGETALKRLLDNAQHVEMRLWAKGAPFDKKDELKNRGYRWSSGEDGQPKAWYTHIPMDKYVDELQYLSTSIYSEKIHELPTKRIDAKLRYSKRI